VTPGGGHLGDLLSALVDGELPAGDASAARAHLGGCPACRTELAATERARALVRGLPLVDPVAPLVTERGGGAGRLVGMVAAVAAVAALLLLPGVGEDQPAPPVGRLVEVHATSAVNADPVSQVTPAVMPMSLR
jgi:anti-sigma factor RsiW